MEASLLKCRRQPARYWQLAASSLPQLPLAYAELAAVETSLVAAHNDYRQAVVSYLYARATLAEWASTQR